MKVKSMMVWAAALVVAACVCAGEVGKSTPSGFTDDFEAAKAEAAKSGKSVLAVFSGSDWGSDLTEKQARGWRNYNDEAFSNLTAATALGKTTNLAP